jgi:phasin family protein
MSDSKTGGAGETAAKTAADGFAGLARAAADQQAAILGEIGRMFQNMPLPGTPDTNALMTAHRRNLEVLSATNKVALENAQAIARRNMEIMQQTMSELSEQMRELTSSESPQAKAARQAELLKRAYERALGNLRETTELIQRSNAEAIELVNRRFKEAMDEVRGLIGSAGEQAGHG